MSEPATDNQASEGEPLADSVPSARARQRTPAEPTEEPGLSTLDAPEAASYEPNRLLRWVYTRFFRHMRIDERWSGVVRESAAQGVVVYVMRSISVLDFLCLDYLLKRFRLPLVHFVNDLGLWILEPFGRGQRRLRRRPQIPQEEALAKVTSEGQSALLFLRRPPRLGEKRTGQRLELDLIRTLVEQQRKSARPILVVPQVFVWTQRPPRKTPSLIDLVFGPSEWPGRVRVFLRFLFNYRNAQLRSGEAFDIAAFLETHQDLTDAQAADRIRYALLRRMERERRIVLGPAKKTAGRVREELIRSPRVRKHLEAAARDRDAPIAQVEREADKELRKLAANLDTNAIRFLQRVLSWVWTKIYDGFVVDGEGMERAQEAARRGPLILLPSHKSHVDYLILSDVLDRNGIAVPLIAAGDNLSFFPLGALLRRCGAFFIRRSFSGRRLYAALVDAYLRKILVEGHNLEFFLEGGRSRTGKLLPPKLGLLSMVVNAGLQLRSVEMSFVPISIGYERIVEERAYTRELEGGEKEPESVGGLLRTGRVLRSRYGRLYIQVGTIYSLKELLEEAATLHGDEDRPVHELKPKERRALVNRIAHRVTYEIDRATIVTPAALVASALLTHARRGMRHTDLADRCAELLAALQRAGARIAPTVVRDDPQVVPPPDAEAEAETARAILRDDALEEALALFADARLVATDGEGEERIHTVRSSKRLALEYYRNTILHFFVPSALIASGLIARKDGTMEEEALRGRVERLSRLFKYEFMYRADATFDDIFDDAIQMMVKAGELERRDDETLAPVEGSLVPVYRQMLRSYFESYRLAVDSLDLLEESPIKRKEWLKQALARGRKQFLAGDIELEEALSRDKLSGALSALHDRGLLKVSRETVERGAALADDEAASALARRFEKYLEG